MSLQVAPPVVAQTKTRRYAHADNLKVLLVAGVIAGHVTMAWTANDAWVLDEPPVREPLLTLLNLVALVGVLFAMATFFLIAGSFTPRSLERKGPRRFVVDRMVRLGVPLVFYLLALAALVEYVDSDFEGWDQGFTAFVLHIWRHPAPGPMWFLEVLLLFSFAYVVVRTVRPRRTAASTAMRARNLLAIGLFVAFTSFAIRIVAPFGEEVVQDLYLGQTPAWVAGFTLGIVGAERGWFDRVSPATSRWLFRIAWSAVAGVVTVVSVTVGAMGGEIDDFFGGGTWQSLVLALLEGALVVAMPLWLFDAFRRRVHHQGQLMRRMSRAAFAAFVVHQAVAVGVVLATRYVSWPPEVEFAVAAALAVIVSFGIGALLVRLPGVSRIV